MRRVRIFPNPVREVDGVWITMADGVRLAARIWMPEDAESEPVPAILEYIPYRKSDHTRARDDLNHPYFAGHGYASIRVDIRGSGDSEGVLTDEYTSQELEDGVRIIDWLAGQPWCDGNVGMIGISWGGFNGLQIAALQPEALKAVITVCSTDDRYADDVHYMGGCMLLDNLSWASVMFAGNASPPDPAVVGDNWRAMWLDRLKGSGLWLDQWTRHQHRDPYWKHGSVCEDFSRVQCPVFAVSGWADGYSNAVFRLLARLEAPCKGLVGPWSHRYPHLGKAGPAIGFLQESLRWWDHWLKGEDTGVMDEPALRAWMLDSIAPARSYEVRPGRWVGEAGWPSAHIVERRFALGDGTLVDAADPDATDAPTDASAPRSICSPLKTGLMAGKWCSYANGPDLAGDQRDDDAGSLVFDTAPLAEPLEILGAVVVELELAVDRPLAMIAARLNDVRPDGSVTRVTYGVLNLTHRDSHENPEPMVPGERYRVRLALNDIGQHFPAGHRLRLSLSSSYWPLVWPSPEPVTLTVWPSASVLCLPVRPPNDADRRLPELARPTGSMPTPNTVIEPGANDWQIVHDLGSGRFSLDVTDAEGVYRLENTDTQIEQRGTERYTAVGDDVLSVEGEARWTLGFQREGWRVRTHTETHMRVDADYFYIRATLMAEEDGEPVYHDEWNISVPRHHV
ncbi:CocE/NonD family hydrolase [Salinisphaera orenii]|uniref:Peptidase S15 n=1 Tax=Salinisphaera orenii YIM 95161 TaxID=1051139 RepID=A0A423PX35_9GAMM|nr:CocE/NonD family hydrolase [Salinisphaera halophila]ROO30170.1 peptidase S15 [Salinisphaera halophila YIM 95161]